MCTNTHADSDDHCLGGLQEVLVRCDEPGTNCFEYNIYEGSTEIVKFEICHCK